MMGRNDASILLGTWTILQWYFRWWEKYLSKRSLIKHTCSWRVNLLYYEHWTDKQKYFYVYQKTLANIRKLEKTVIKYSSYTNHLHFFLRCHHNKILPKELQPKSRIKIERSKIILQRASKLLLQERIHINHVIHDRLKNSIEQLKGEIVEPLTPEEYRLIEKIYEIPLN